MAGILPPNEQIAEHRNDSGFYRDQERGCNDIDKIKTLHRIPVHEKLPDGYGT